MKPIHLNIMFSAKMDVSMNYNQDSGANNIYWTIREDLYVRFQTNLGVELKRNFKNEAN